MMQIKWKEDKGRDSYCADLEWGKFGIIVCLRVGPHNRYGDKRPGYYFGSAHIGEAFKQYGRARSSVAHAKSDALRELVKLIGDLRHSLFTLRRKLGIDDD